MGSRPFHTLSHLLQGGTSTAFWALWPENASKCQEREGQAALRASKEDSVVSIQTQLL